TSRHGQISVRAALEPARDLLETVDTPERLAIDDDIRGPEHAARDGGIDFVSEPVFEHVIFECGQHLGARQTLLLRNLNTDGSAGNIMTVDEISVVKRLCEGARKLRVAVVRPVEEP